MEEKKSIKIYPLGYGQNVWLFKVSGKTLLTDKTYGYIKNKAKTNQKHCYSILLTALK